MVRCFAKGIAELPYTSNLGIQLMRYVAVGGLEESGASAVGYTWTGVSELGAAASVEYMGLGTKEV